MNVLSQGDATAHTKVHNSLYLFFRMLTFPTWPIVKKKKKKKKKLCVHRIATRMDLNPQVCVTLYSLSWLYFTL